MRQRARAKGWLWSQWCYGMNPREGWRQKVAIVCLEAGLHRVRIGNGIAHVALDGPVLSCFLQADDRAAASATFTGHRARVHTPGTLRNGA